MCIIGLLHHRLIIAATYKVILDIVWPADIDIFLHMNNGRYRRAMDFARLIFYAECGLLDYLMETGTQALMVAATGRYRRPLKLFQKYDIVTKVGNVDLLAH